MRKLLMFALVCLATFASGSTSVSGNLKDLKTGIVTSRSFVRFELVNCGTNLPRLLGDAVIPMKHIDFKPNSSGVFSGTLYSNDEIDCAGLQNTRYKVTVFYDGINYFSPNEFVINGSTWSLNDATPYAPVVTIANVPQVVLKNPTATQSVTQAANTNFQVATTGSGRILWDGPTEASTYFDFKKISSPDNPASTHMRLFANTDTGRLECKKSDGTSCGIGGGGGSVYDVLDYASPQAAIDAAFSAGGGKVLAPSSETYTGSITLKSNVVLECVDRTTVFTLANGANANIITLASSTSNAEIRNCTLNGNGSNQSSNGMGITIGAGSSNITLDNVAITNLRSMALNAAGTTGSPITGLTVTNSSFSSANSALVALTDVDNFKFTGNSVTSWGNSSLSDGLSIDLTATRSNWQILGNYFLAGAHSAHAIAQDPGHASLGIAGLKVSDNIFDSNGGNANGGAGVAVEANGASITNNVFRNGGSAGSSWRQGIEFYGSDTSITGNVIKNASILVAPMASGLPSYNVKVENNEVTSGFGSVETNGIYVGGSATPGSFADMYGVSVSNNTVDLTAASYATTPSIGIFINPSAAAQGFHNVKVNGNLIRGTSHVRGLAWSISTTASNDWQIKHNTIAVSAVGINIPATNTVTDVTITDNQLGTSTTAIGNSSTGGVFRIEQNVLTTTQPSVSTTDIPNGVTFNLMDDGSIISADVARFGQGVGIGYWKIQNAGSPTTRRSIAGYDRSNVQQILLDPDSGTGTFRKGVNAGPTESTLDSSIQGYSGGTPSLLVTRSLTGSAGIVSETQNTANDGAAALANYAVSLKAVTADSAAESIAFEGDAIGQPDTAKTLAAVWGIKGQGINQGAGTVTAAGSMRALAAANVGGGTITNSYGLYVEDFHATGTNNYGIYIADQGTGTNDYALKVEGGKVVMPDFRLSTMAAPTCDSAHRGQFNYVAGAAGVKDVVQVCAKDASDVYAWRTIY